MIYRSISLAAAISGSLLAVPANASTLPFSGTIENVTPPGAPGGRCGAPPVLTLTFTPETTSGTSNIGDFRITGSHCVTPTPPVTTYDGGQFQWRFDNGDLLQGIYVGTVVLVSGQPAQNVQQYLVTGGTGRFVNARGKFRHVGSFTFGPGGVTTGRSTFNGTLCVQPGRRHLGEEDFRTIGGMVASPPVPSIEECARQLD